MSIFKKYVLFLNDTEDDYHFGCSATSLAIKHHLKIKFKNKDIVSVGVQDIWKAQFPPQNEEDFFSSSYLKKYIKANNILISLIKGAFEIYINGEGTLLGFDNRKGTQNLLYLTYIAEKFGKNVSIINHSCFPKCEVYEENKYEKVYSFVYNRLKRCIVRDIRSLAILNSYGCKNVTLGFDCCPLYIDEIFTEQKIDYEVGSYILISGGISLAQNFKNFLKDNIGLFKQTGKRVVFLMSNTKILAQDDLLCIKNIFDFNKTSDFVIDVFYAKNTDEFLTLIKNAYFQITGRFHHSIVATWFGTPFFVFETHSPKNKIFSDLFFDSFPLKKLNVKMSSIEEIVNLENKNREIDRIYIKRLCMKNFE